MAIKIVMDVSRWQGSIDWAKLAAVEAQKVD
jgi:GH25 family lysozyme M1 (1,4-beta-N-acetylmuramidase)